MDMRGSLGLSLCSLSALDPAWMPCTTPAGRLRLDWFGGGRCAAAFQPAGWFLLVVPASLLASPGGLGTCVGCSTLGLSQPHVRISALCVAVHVHSCGRCGQRRSRSRFRQLRPSRSPVGQAEVQSAKPRSSRPSRGGVGRSKSKPVSLFARFIQELRFKTDAFPVAVGGFTCSSSSHVAGNKNRFFFSGPTPFIPISRSKKDCSYTLKKPC